MHISAVKMQVWSYSVSMGCMYVVSIQLAIILNTCVDLVGVTRAHTPAVHLCCNVKLNVWDRRTGRSLRSPNFVSIFPPFPPFFTMIDTLSLIFYVSTLNSTNLPIFYPHLCLLVDISPLVLRLAPFRNFFELSLLQNDFQLDRLAKVT